MRAAGTADVRIAVAAGNVFHAGPKQIVRNEIVFSKELFFGKNTPGSTSALAPAQPASVASDLLSDGKDTIVMLEQDVATVIDGATGAVRMTADLKQFNLGTRRPAHFAVSPTGLFKREVSGSTQEDRREELHFFSFASKTWKKIYDMPETFYLGAFTAADGGVYAVESDRSVVFVGEDGKTKTLSATLPKHDEFIRFYNVVVDDTNVYVSGTTATAGERYCGGVGVMDNPVYVVYAVPKAGGSSRTIIKAPIEDHLALTLEGSANESLVARSRCSHAGLWVMPPQPNAKPKKLLAPSAAVDEIGTVVAVKDGYAYFTTKEGSLLRACSDL